MCTAFRAGWAEVNLTPEKKVRLAGQFCERISEYVETPVCVTALALDSGSDSVIFCACDMESIGMNLVEGVRAQLKETIPDFDGRKLIVSATHTHTSIQYDSKTLDSDSTLSVLKQYTPDNVRYEDPLPAGDDVITDAEALVHLTNRIAEAAAAAWRDRKPAQFANELGRAAVGMCRRAKYDDKSAKMWGDTNTSNFVALEGGSDTGLELLYFFDEAGKLTGVMANLACPAQAVQHRTFVSSDFWGKAKEQIRKALGADVFLLPICSPAGDQCPVDLIRWVEPESDVHDPNLKRTNPPKRKADPSMFDLAGMKKAGKRIANEIIEVFDEGLDPVQEDPAFEHHVHMMQRPVRRATMREYNEARKAIREYLRDKEGDVDFNDAAALQVHLGILRRYKLQEIMDILDTEVHIIRLGSIAIATNPFELFLDYGNQIKTRSLAEQTFLVQLANGTEGYLPTEKAERGGHYSAFISSGQVGHVGGEQLVRETLKDINHLFAE